MPFAVILLLLPIIINQRFALLQVTELVIVIMGGVIAFIATLVLNITLCIAKPRVVQNAFYCVCSRHWFTGADNQVTISHCAGQFITFNPSALARELWIDDCITLQWIDAIKHFVRASDLRWEKLHCTVSMLCVGNKAHCTFHNIIITDQNGPVSASSHFVFTLLLWNKTICQTEYCSLCENRCIWYCECLLLPA